MGELTAICQDGSIRYLDTQLKGAPTGVLLLFLLNAGLVFNEDDLQFYTGYSRPTLHSALRSLARYELVQQLGERPVWSLTAHVKQLTFVGDLAAVDEKNIFLPSSSSILDPDHDSKLLLTTSTSAPEKNFSQALVDRLREAGVYAGPAEALAGDPWVTEARVEAWVQRLREDRRVRSVGAVLYTNLRNHLEAGPVEEDEGDYWRKFVERRNQGPKIEICPNCHQHPCACEEN